MTDEMSCRIPNAPGGEEAGQQIILSSPPDSASNLVSRVVLVVAPGRLGLTLQFVARRTGAVIRAIHPTCTFGNLVFEGDCIVSIDGRSVLCSRDLRVGEDRNRVLSIIRHSAANRTHAWAPAPAAAAAANGNRIKSCVSDGAISYQTRERSSKTAINHYRSDNALAHRIVQIPALSDSGSSRDATDELGIFYPSSSKSNIEKENLRVKSRWDCIGIRTSERDQENGDTESHKENMDLLRKPIEIGSTSVHESLNEIDDESKRVPESEPTKIESLSFYAKLEETDESSEEEEVPTCAKQCQDKDQQEGGVESMASLRKTIKTDETHKELNRLSEPIKRESRYFYVKQEETDESSEEEGVPNCTNQCQHKDQQSHEEKYAATMSLRKPIAESRRFYEPLKFDEKDNESKRKWPREKKDEPSEKEGVLTFAKQCQHEDQIKDISPPVIMLPRSPKRTTTIPIYSEAGGNSKTTGDLWRSKSQSEQEGQILYRPKNAKHTIPRNLVSTKRKRCLPSSSAHLLKEEGGFFEGIALNNDGLCGNGNLIQEATGRLQNKKNTKNLPTLAEEDVPADLSTAFEKLETTKGFMLREEMATLAKKDTEQIFPYLDLFSMCKRWAQSQPNAILNNIDFGKCIMAISIGINTRDLKQPGIERVLMALLYMHKSKPVKLLQSVPKGDIEQPVCPRLQKAAHLINLAANSPTIEASVNGDATANGGTASTAVPRMSPDSIGSSSHEQVPLSLLHTELFLPRNCHLSFKSMDGRNGHQIRMRKSQLGLPQLKSLFAKASLKVPSENTMEKLGSVSTSTSSGTLVSCLLFKKDESSEGIKIFDIVRLVTEPNWQRKGFATKSMNTFMILLRHNFPRSKIVIRADVLRRTQVKSFYSKVGFTKGVPSGLSTGYNCGRPDCDAYHFEVKHSVSKKKKGLLTNVSMHQTFVEGYPDTMLLPNLKHGNQSQLQPPHYRSYSQSLSQHVQTMSQHPKPVPLSKTCRQSNQPDPQIQLLPRIEVYCSPHSRLKVKGADLCNQNISIAESFDSNGINALLRRARLLPLNNTVHQVGSVNLRTRPCSPRSCLIFKRDDESSALSTQIFDIARLTVGKDSQSIADAKHCLDVFGTLLRQNFPCDKIILRAAVLNRLKKFYESVGFTKGVPWGLSSGPYCGHNDCATFHLLVQEPLLWRAAKKRARPPLSTEGKDAGAVALARGSTCAKRIREQADFLNSEGQMVPNSQKAEVKGSSELLLAERASVAANFMTKKCPKNKLKSNKSHNGCQFTGSNSEFCRCLGACSPNCPIKQRINGETGVARAFETHGEPIGHTQEVRQSEVEVVSGEFIEPVNQRSKRVASVVLKRRQMLQGCNGGAYSDDNKPRQIQQKLDVSTPTSADSKAAIMAFRKGQHVWACMGKGRHPALILSIQNDVTGKSSNFVTVKWTTSNTRSKVKVNYLIPMFEEEDSDSVPVKRRRLQRTAAATCRSLQKNCLKGDDVTLPNPKKNSSRGKDYRKQKGQTGIASCPKLIMGSRALVLCKGKLFKATILKQSSKNLRRVLIHYDGHRKTNKHWITHDMISKFLDGACKG